MGRRGTRRLFVPSPTSRSDPGTAMDHAFLVRLDELRGIRNVWCRDSMLCLSTCVSGPHERRDH